MRTPLCIDLFCGLGGWTEGFLANGYRCIGFDVEAHDYGQGGYPGELRLRDVRSVHGSEFKDAACIVASPPCQAYSYRAMPWKRAKALPPPDNTLFNECFRIQREAIAAAGHHIPMVVENVRGAEKWVGAARWHFGSYYLWGDLPALMPLTFRGTKLPKGNGSGAPMWKDRPIVRLAHQMPDELAATDAHIIGRKVPGFRFDGSGRSFQTASVEGIKVSGCPSRTGVRFTTRDCGPEKDSFGWSKNTPLRNNSSKSNARKAASAEIAKIPFPLADHIAKCFLPRHEKIHSCA